MPIGREARNKVKMDGSSVVAAEASEEEVMAEAVAAIVAAFERRRANLIPILQKIQQAQAYLSPQAMRMVAEYLQLSPSEVLGVATFYNQFRFHPPGKHQIKVCLGTACHVVGGDIILENFERKLGIKEGETTADREFSIERVACVGCCALAPVTIVDDVVQAHMAPSKVEGLLLGFEIEKEQERRERQQGESES